jgi:hypothetical protein
VEELQPLAMARFLCDTQIAMSNKKVIPKKRGRPATGKDPHVSFRLGGELRESVDAYAASANLTRSEAIRHLVEYALSVAKPADREK